MPTPEYVDYEITAFVNGRYRADVHTCGGKMCVWGKAVGCGLSTGIRHATCPTSFSAPLGWQDERTLTMRSIRPSWLLIAITAAAVGCIPSLYPIYTEQDVVMRREIVGRWTNGDNTQSWTFSPAEGNAYELVFVDKEGRDATFTAHLTEISEVLFMDLYPKRSSEADPDFYNLHLVSTHTFFRVGLNEEKLSLSFLDPQWLKRLDQEKPSSLFHVRHDNSVVLTADTTMLRDFVAKHLDSEGAFTNPFVLTKVTKE